MEDLIPFIAAFTGFILLRIFSSLGLLKRIRKTVKEKSSKNWVVKLIADKAPYAAILLFILTIVFAVNNNENGTNAFFLIFFAFLILSLLFLALTNIGELERDDVQRTQTFASSASQGNPPPVMVYHGNQLNFNNTEIEMILIKHFPYYSSLSYDNKEIFISRLKKFISEKVFKIHHTTGYKEMPILISAAAIQLTFGLKSYLLPHFEFIHIYPEEFARINHSITFLEGNVTGRRINLSWKHFLDGYKVPDDGQNVGLHEMSHALYYQIFEVDENTHRPFKRLYNDFLENGKRVYQYEKDTAGGIYSDYAMRNIHEFWAESIELFFEKPRNLKMEYPELYADLSRLLNQDPSGE